LLSIGAESFVFQFASNNLKIMIYKTIIMPVVLYEWETWSLTREEHRLRVSENRVLRGIFGPKRDKVIREWRKLHNKDLNDLYCSPNIIWVIKTRRMRWVGHVACMGREAYTGFWWGNLGERGHLVNPGADGRLILRWIFKKGGCRGMDLIELAHDKDRWQEIVNVVCSQFLAR